MPVIINSAAIHPFLPSLGTPLAIESARAEHQDIRPLEIAIINLMADKQTTERQLALWLGNTSLQVKLTFATTDTYFRDVNAGRETKNTPADHIRKFYSAWSEIKDRKFDGFIVTGVNALKDRVSDEDIWPEVQAILRWSESNVLSSLFLCWGAKAALKHFHDVESYKSQQKLFGLFEHRLVSDKTGLLFGFPDLFSVPVSRWKSPRREDILKHEGPGDRRRFGGGRPQHHGRERAIRPRQVPVPAPGLHPQPPGIRHRDARRRIQARRLGERGLAAAAALLSEERPGAARRATAGATPRTSTPTGSRRSTKRRRTISGIFRRRSRGFAFRYLDPNTAKQGAVRSVNLASLTCIS